jgi:hypoxanthine phosphoribosyltransferase
VRLVKDIELPIEGKDVIIVEDIVDIGYTLAFLVEHLKKKRPASLRICVFIDKRERRKVDVKLDYVGFEASGFLVGYGLDFSEQYRHLPAVYRLVKEESNKQ